MNVDEIKNRLTTEQIIQLMDYFGADIGNPNYTDHIEFTSICHNSNSHKLYYYINTKSWYCWSHCGGNVDIFSIVMEQEGITFQESLKWVENFFNLGENRGFGREFYVPPKREIIKKPIDITEQLPYYEESILNTFSNKLPIEWLQEGMLEEILKQFEIKIDINTCSIIIPHRDLNGKLIGVRCRNLKEESIEKFGKYTPYT